MGEVIERQQSLPTVEAPAVSTPAQLLQVAIQNGADLDRLEQLMDMQIKWEANEARKAFVKAMSDFRSEAPTIGKNKSAHNSNYASIDNITETINPLLAKHNLSFSWVTEQADAITVHCDVTHAQGHSQRVSLTASPDTTGSKNAIQAIGSTVSYLQRYTLLSALGLATGEMDNDGGAQVECITSDQADVIHDIVADHPDKDFGVRMLAWLEQNGVASVEEIPAKHWKNYLGQIQKAAAKK